MATDKQLIEFGKFILSDDEDYKSFGRYLISKERRQLFRSVRKDLLQERLAMVHHADIENWKNLMGKGN